MHTIGSRHLLAASVIALGAALTSPVAAQTTTPSSSAAAAVDSGASGDIVVTARKKEERLRDVPVAVTALGSAYLAQKNITQIVDLTVEVPNFTYSTATTQPQLFIRGFGSGTNSGFDQSVGKFVNNVYFGRDQDGKLPLFDVERIEVLKGPQVVTFGNSATAGAINITTKEPGDRFSVDGSAAYEFVDHETKLQGGISLPIGEGVSFRLAGYYQDLARGDNYNALLDRHELQTKAYAFRPTLKLDLAPGFRITLMGEYDHVKTLGTPIEAIMQPRRAGAPQYAEVDDPDLNNVDYTRAPVSSEGLSEINHGMGLLDMRYDMLGGTLVSTTAYRKEKVLVQLGLPGPNYNEVSFQHGLQHYNQVSQELRFSATYEKLDITVGGYFEHDNLHINQLVDSLFGGYGTTGIAATPVAKIAFFDQKFNKYSGSLDATYHLVGGLSLSAGVRYSRYEKTADQLVFGANVPPGVGFDTTRSYLYGFRSAVIEATALTPVTGAVAHDYTDLNLKEGHWQPQAIAQYKFGDNMAYAKFASGSKAGGFDYFYGSANPSGIHFGPEKATEYELGLKGLIFDRKLDYAIALFREDFKNLQSSVFVSPAFIVTNVGKARSQGVELELNYRPVTGLRFGVTGSYLDAKYIDFPNAPCDTLQVLTAVGTCRQDLSGKPLQYASKWSGNFSVDYEHPVSSYVLGGGVSVFARTHFNVSASNDPGAIQAGFGQIDAHLDLKPAQGVWAVSLFGRNLSDKRYINYAVAPGGNTTALLGGYERGRQLGLKLSVAY